MKIKLTTVALATISLAATHASITLTESTKTDPSVITSSRGWTKTMGYRSLFKAVESDNGDYVAVISGAHGLKVQLPTTSYDNLNTLYILDGATGKVLLTNNFLQDSPEVAWADQSYQSLTPKFQGNQLVISGSIFTGMHPQKVPYTTSIDLPAIPGAQLGSPIVQERPVSTPSPDAPAITEVGSGRDLWITGDVFSSNNVLFFRAANQIEGNSSTNLVVLGSRRQDVMTVMPILTKLAEKKMKARLYGLLAPSNSSFPDYTGEPLPNYQFIVWKFHMPTDPDVLPTDQGFHPQSRQVINIQLDGEYVGMMSDNQGNPYNPLTLEIKVGVRRSINPPCVSIGGTIQLPQSGVHGTIKGSALYQGQLSLDFASTGSAGDALFKGTLVNNTLSGTWKFISKDGTAGPSGLFTAVRKMLP